MAGSGADCLDDELQVRSKSGQRLQRRSHRFEKVKEEGLKVENGQLLLQELNFSFIDI
jgi:hypothetical protein